jgi:hypothetical protein
VLNRRCYGIANPINLLRRMRLDLGGYGAFAHLWRKILVAFTAVPKEPKYFRAGRNKEPKYFRAGRNTAESSTTSLFEIRQPKLIQESIVT